MAVVPAAAVPVPSQVGIVWRNSHDVAHARGNVPQATRAEVALDSLVRLEESSLCTLDRRRVHPLANAGVLGAGPPFGLAGVGRLLLGSGRLLLRPAPRWSPVSHRLSVSANPLREERPGKENEDGDERGRDEEVVEGCALVLSPRVESHGNQYGVSRLDHPVATVSACSSFVVQVRQSQRSLDRS